MRVIVLLITTMTIIVSVIACGGNSASDNSNVDTLHYSLPDTLRVATLYSPTSYFIYRDAKLGYDYSLVSQFCEDNNIKMDLVVAPNMSAMIELLD